MNNKSSEITETAHDNWIKALVDEMMEEYNETEKDKEFALMMLKDELDFRQKKIEFYNLEIEKNIELLAEQKVKIDEVKAEMERIDRR